jgi:hypothetical protein
MSDVNWLALWGEFAQAIDNRQSQGVAFVGSESAWVKAEQRAWPSKAANFLKHADRDVDDHLPIEEVNNEYILMGASTAYLHLMKILTPEITGYFAFWAAKNNAIGDLGDEIRDFARHLAAMPEAERYSACSCFVADQKKPT